MTTAAGALAGPGVHLAIVEENRALGGGAYLLRLRQPEIAAGFRPGQFVGVRVSAAGTWDPLLRRPFSVMRSSGRSRHRPGDSLELLHVVVGRGTRAMAALAAGDQVDLLGPLGNSFFDAPFELQRPGQRIVIAAGGVGVAPFFAVADWLIEEGRAADLVICFGARTRALLCGAEELQLLGCRVLLATDDGSAGQRGLVTELVAGVLAEEPGRPALVLACGPDPMMHATAAVAAAAGVRCLVSLENDMPCGVGICFGCVTYQPAGAGGAARYVRACVEGPVFAAERLGWGRQMCGHPEVLGS